MKRLLKIILCLLIFSSFFLVNAYGVETNIDEYNKEFEIEKLIENIDDETLEILNQIGITEISFDSIFKVSPQRMLNAVLELFSLNFKEDFKSFLIPLGIIIIKVFMLSINYKNEAVGFISDCVLSLALVVPLGKIISLSYSVIQVLSGFTVAFSGVFCGIISAGGNVTMGASYANLSVVSNAFITSVLKEFSEPLINTMCSLGFLSCFDSFNLIDKFSKYLKNFYIFALSLVGTVFSGIVTVKGVLSNNMDSVSSRGIRFLVGKSLPLVGGAVSETYSSLLTGLLLIKNTVGIFGIITVVIMVLPVFIKLILWVFFMDFLMFFSDALTGDNSSKILPAFKSVGVLLLSTISLIAVIFIVNVGVVIAVKGGVAF